MPFVLGQGFVSIDLDDSRVALRANSLKRVVGSAGTRIGRSMEAAASIITGTMVAALVAATVQAAKFEKQMAEIRTLLDVTDEDFKKLTESTLDLSVVLGTRLTDTTKGLYDALSARIPRENVVDFLGVSAKASIAGVTNVSTAVDGLTSIINAYNLSAKDAGMISDKLFTAVRLGKTRFSELNAQLGRVLPIAKAAGVSFDELLAMLVNLTNQGLSTEIAVTALRSTMNQMLKPGKDLKENLDLLSDELGIVNWQSIGLSNTLQLLSKSVDGDGQAMAQMFRNIRGLNAVMALTGERAGEVQKSLAEITDSSGAMEEAFKKVDKTASRTFDKLKASIKAAFIQVGDGLLPVMKELTEQINMGLDEYKFKVWGQAVINTVKEIIKLYKMMAEAQAVFNDIIDPVRLRDILKLPAHLMFDYDQPRHGKAPTQEERNAFSAERRKAGAINVGGSPESRRLLQRLREDMKNMSNATANGADIIAKKLDIQAQLLKEAREADRRAQEKFDEIANRFGNPFDNFVNPIEEQLKALRKQPIPRAQFIGLDAVFRMFSTTGASQRERQIKLLEQQLEEQKKAANNIEVLIEEGRKIPGRFR